MRESEQKRNFATPQAYHVLQLGYKLSLVTVRCKVTLMRLEENEPLDSRFSDSL